MSLQNYSSVQLAFALFIRMMIVDSYLDCYSDFSCFHYLEHTHLDVQLCFAQDFVSVMLYLSRLRLMI